MEGVKWTRVEKEKVNIRVNQWGFSINEVGDYLIEN